jgi:hypothetical protein
MSRPQISPGSVALGWWRGEPLVEDAYADWAGPVRAELGRLHLEALEGATEAALRLGDPARAVEFAEMAVAHEPLREAARMLLMRSLYLSGDRAGALRTFEELRWDLAKELGVDPSPEVVQLHVEVLRGDLRVDESLRRVVGGNVLDEQLKGALGRAGGGPLRSLALSQMASFAAGADDYRRASRPAPDLDGEGTRGSGRGPRRAAVGGSRPSTATGRWPRWAPPRR